MTPTMTNHPRTNYLYQFTGKIIHKRLAIAPPHSKYAGQSYYVLTLLQADHSKKSIQVFRSKLSQDQIWTAIKQGTYSGQYDFLCRNQKGYFYLVDWKKKPTQSEPQNHHDLN